MHDDGSSKDWVGYPIKSWHLSVPCLHPIEKD